MYLITVIEYAKVQHHQIEHLNIKYHDDDLQEAPELWASLVNSPALVQDLHLAVVHLLITFVSLLQDRDGQKKKQKT